MAEVRALHCCLHLPGVHRIGSQPAHRPGGPVLVQHGTAWMAHGWVLPRLHSRRRQKRRGSLVDTRHVFEVHSAGQRSNSCLVCPRLSAVPRPTLAHQQSHQLNNHGRSKYPERNAALAPRCNARSSSCSSSSCFIDKLTKYHGHTRMTTS